MCSFGSCQTCFEFLSQFRKVRNAFECFVTQVHTHLPKTKRVWPMKINVICTVKGHAIHLMLRYLSPWLGSAVYFLHNYYDLQSMPRKRRLFSP